MAAERYRATSETLDPFAREQLVVCPGCAQSAVVRVREPPLPPESWMAQREATLACRHCGYHARRTGHHPWLNLPLWLTASCAGQTLYVLNEQHLDALKAYVRAALRERRPDPQRGWSNRVWTSRLPRWIAAAKNREAVLQCIGTPAPGAPALLSPRRTGRAALAPGSAWGRTPR